MNINKFFSYLFKQGVETPINLTRYGLASILSYHLYKNLENSRSKLNTELKNKITKTDNMLIAGSYGVLTWFSPYVSALIFAYDSYKRCEDCLTKLSD